MKNAGKTESRNTSANTDTTPEDYLKTTGQTTNQTSTAQQKITTNGGYIDGM